MLTRALRLAAVLGLSLGASLAGADAPGTDELLMFETPSCPWCVAWNREVGVVYARTEEGRQLPLRRLDVDSGAPPGVSLATPVHYTPTFVLARGGREIGRITGYPGEDHFWGLLGALIERSGGLAPGIAGRTADAAGSITTLDGGDRE